MAKSKIVKNGQVYPGISDFTTNLNIPDVPPSNRFGVNRHNFHISSASELKFKWVIKYVGRLSQSVPDDLENINR